MILGLCRAAGVRLFVTGGLIAVGLSIATSGAQALDVQITGAMPDDLAAKVRASSLLVEQTTDDIADLPAQIVAAAQADYRRILAVLYNAGYFGGVVQITLDGREAAGFATVGNVPDVARAVIVVDPRQQFRLSRATITPIANGTELPQGFAKGEIARLSTLRETAAAGVDGWRNQGHAKAALARQDLTADHRTGQLAADLGIAPGPQLRFGPLVLRNPSAVRTDRIRDIAGLPTGTVFSPEEIALAEGRLRRAGAFRSVSLTEAETIGPENTLPIEAILTDAPPRRFGFGAEIATLDGLTLSGFWLHRNLLGGSERLRVEGEIAGIGGQTGGEDFRFAARFGRPATFNEDTDFYALAEI
jgi:translocation and assembly module TamA